MKKKYLKTIEDIEALRNTDTVIHYGCDEMYVLKFVNGVLCSLYKANQKHFHEYGFVLNVELHKPYIEVEDEPSEDYIGKLGRFWDDDENDYLVSFLIEIKYNAYKDAANGCFYEHFRPLTPEEVEKYTGYKVVKEK